MSEAQAGDGICWQLCCVLKFKFKFKFKLNNGDCSGDSSDGIFYAADDGGSSHLVAKDTGEDGDVVGLIEHFLRRPEPFSPNQSFLVISKAILFIAIGRRHIADNLSCVRIPKFLPACKCGDGDDHEIRWECLIQEGAWQWGVMTRGVMEVKLLGTGGAPSSVSFPRSSSLQV